MTKVCDFLNLVTLVLLRAMQAANIQRRRADVCDGEPFNCLSRRRVLNGFTAHSQPVADPSLPLFLRLHSSFIAIAGMQGIA